MSSCVTTPTATRTSLSTSSSESTSFSEIVTTFPGQVDEITSIFCAETSNGTCASTTTEVITTTQDGEVVTSTVPVLTTTFISVQTELQTLFGTSCTPISTPDDDGPSSSSTTSSTFSASNNAPITSETDMTQITSQPPATTFMSSSATTLPGGSVSYEVLTVTSTPAASIVNVPATQTPGSNNDSSSDNLGAIIGGAVGGFFGVIGIVLAIWFVLKRRRRWDDIFEKENERLGGGSGGGRSSRFSLGEDDIPEPKPYAYGFVGATTSPPLQASPPQSHSGHGDPAGFSSSYNTTPAASTQVVTNRQSTALNTNLPPAGGMYAPAPMPSRPVSTTSSEILQQQTPHNFERAGSPVSLHQQPLRVVNVRASTVSDMEETERILMVRNVSTPTPGPATPLTPLSVHDEKALLMGQERDHTGASGSNNHELSPPAYSIQ